MIRRRSRIWIAALATAIPLAAAAAQDVDPQLLAEFRQDPLKFFYELRQVDALRYGQAILRSEEEPVRTRVETLKALACIYSALPEPALARASLMEILSLQPGSDLERPERLPPPVVRAYYALRDSIALAGGAAGSPGLDVRTLAIGDIENNSVARDPKLDLDKFALGLTHLVTTDLLAVSPLRIVDRQRLNVLKSEIEMTQNDAIFDPETRVRFGRLTGAQSFLFGSLMLLDGGRMRIDFRIVDTSTGEILIAEKVEGRVRSSGDLLKLEEKLVLQTLAPKLDEMVHGAGGGEGAASGAVGPLLKSKRGRFGGDGVAYLDLLTRAGEAFLAEDSGDYTAAAAAWNEVLTLDPTNEFAKSRSHAASAYTNLAMRERE